MKKQVFLVVGLLFYLHLQIYANANKKISEAVRTSSSIKIDGVLDEEIWETAKIVSDFIQYTPYNGHKPSKRTEVKLVYNNNALYVGAILYDIPQNIETGFSKRDEFGNADYFVLTLLPFNDGLNGYQFFVSAADVQMDEKVTSNNGFQQIRSWDAVWKSKARVSDEGWIVEMEIPFSEIRFPKKNVQKWGVNFWRKIQKLNEWASFSYVNQKVSGPLSQSGELIGIEGIDPPLRLSFIPYLTNSINKVKENSNWEYRLGGGMDVKLGINESFTLDMMLIPDFSEVEPDDLILNLSTTENRFEEKRPFFTEGTELFERGGVFYSKRIGKKPSNYDDVEADLENGIYSEIIDNPLESKLINATKITGRTNKGLGIGFFNAITNNTYATVGDENGIEKEVLTDPFTNYNMLVFDQSFKNNSYLSIFNTNVWRKKDYIANVSGTEFRFENNKNSYSILGKAVVSQKYIKSGDNEFGHRLYMDFAKIKGNFRFNLVQLMISNTYDHNDMGYLGHNNRLEFREDFKYNFYDPFWIFLNWHNTLSFSHGFLYFPREYAGTAIDFSTSATFKNNWTFAIDTYWTPGGWSDYFYLGVNGRNFNWTEWFGMSTKVSTDDRKKFSLSLIYSLGKNFGEFIKYNQKHFRIGIRPKFRINHNIQISYDFLYESDHYLKLVDNVDEEHIYMGQGHVPTFSNTLTANYVFNNKSSLSLRIRHYWSRADYKYYFEVKQDGSLEFDEDYSKNHNINYNALNFNLVYTWQFAPGSELSIIWKSAIDEEENSISTNSFLQNFRNTLNLPMAGILSMKLLYYMDWQKLKENKN